MLISSSLLQWALIQILISGSESTGCSKSQGFHMLPGTQRSLKLFTDVDRNRDQAKLYCHDLGLTMVKASRVNAGKIRNLLKNEYGSAWTVAWLDAKFNGVQFEWSDGELIKNRDYLWRPGHPKLNANYDCLVSKNNYAFAEYYSESCSNTRQVFCECKPTENPILSTEKQNIHTEKPNFPNEKPILPIEQPKQPTERLDLPTGARSYCDNCGMSTTIGLRIQGGQQATKGEYPWQVYLGINPGRYGGRCGGSIIKKRWILSAAHCLDKKVVGTISILEIRVGAHYLQDLSNNQIVVFNQQEVADRVTTHPDYDENTYANDIALIKLKEDLEFTIGVAPVCLADVSDFAAGKKGVATGWGKEAYKAYTASEILLEVVLDTIDLGTCQDLYQKTTNKHVITDKMICTLTPGKDACLGDSGGPLVVQLDNGKWVQVGITSFGEQCAQPNAPGVYTNVAKYKTWIDMKTGSNQC